MTSLPTSIRLKKALFSSLTAPFGLVSLCAALACGAKDAGAPGAASPDAPPAAAEGAGANVGAAATPPAPSAPPATPRDLPDFCGDVSNVPPLDPAGRATHLRDGFVFVEGAAWSATKNAFFFSEMDFDHQGKNGPPSKIHKLTLPGTIEVFIPESGSNGLAIDDQGIVAATHDTQTLSRFNLDTKERTVFVADYQGKHFNSPNDVAIHSQGHVYFTDPDWQIGERPNETGVTGVYWRKPSGEVVLIDGSLDKPNGVTLSPDETHLYVGSASNVVQVYDVLADGNVSNRRVFADVKEPDGMAVDCAGRLFVASHPVGDVLIFAPDGKLLSLIKVAPRVTNVAFGGADRRTILITAGSGVYTARSEIPGFPY